MGKKTETELERQGQQHRVIKIDWNFKSPDGTVYDDLKTALSVAKKSRSKFEKWEIMANKPVKILEAAPAYVTLKQQLDDELDDDDDIFVRDTHTLCCTECKIIYDRKNLPTCQVVQHWLRHPAGEVRKTDDDKVARPKS